MLLRLSRILHATQIAALVLLLGLGAALHHYLSRFDTASRWVQHHLEVIDEIGRARLEVLRTGVWLRNYVAEPLPSSLTTARSSATKAVDAVLRLQLLVQDNPAQQSHALSLAAEMASLVSTYRTAADAAKLEGGQALQALLVLLTRQDGTRLVRDRLNGMEEQERLLLKNWSTEQERHLSEVKNLLSVAGAVVAVALLWSMWHSQRLLLIGRQTEAQLTSYATEDPLTGLLNRRELHQRLIRLVQRITLEKGLAAVLLFDLDAFKPVNDHHGHAAGDEVLKIVGARLRQQCRERDLIARLGGDEFVVVLSSMPSLEAVRATVERIRVALLEPISVGAAQVQISASVGIALLPTDALVPEQLLQIADARMYKAKSAGKGKLVSWSAFTEEAGVDVACISTKSASR